MIREIARWAGEFLGLLMMFGVLGIYFILFAA
jgi:hypothetical protein